MFSVEDEALVRAEILEAYEAVPLARHEEMIRLILAETTLLAERYRNVRRHDIPHVREIAGLLDVLWQEVEMAAASPPELQTELDMSRPLGAFRHWQDGHSPQPAYDPSSDRRGA
jgi:hypothetical protein